MALSFKDSLEKSNKINQNEMASVYSENNGYAVYSDGSILLQNSDAWTVSEKYSFYDEYVDENISIIDNLKNISLNPAQINITQESNSQFIPFEMNRYYDGVDLMNMVILVHYVTAQGYEEYSSVINVKYSEDKIKFGWLINKNATAHEGILQFEIKAMGVNSHGDEYVWYSRINNQLNVLASLHGDGVVEPDQSWTSSFFGQITEKVSEAQKYANDANEAATTAASEAAEETKLQIVDKVSTEIVNNINLIESGDAKND